MEVWTALLLGLAGSLHCAGMCGPLALGVCGGCSGRAPRGIDPRLLYNLGRVSTYALLGLVAGVLGQLFHFAGLQQGLSIGLGVLLLLGGLLHLAGRFSTRWTLVMTRPLAGMKKLFLRLAGRFTAGPMFLLGLLNGLLPCGLVYVALAGAALAGSGGAGAAYMGLFGLGTLPVMLVFSFGGRWFPAGLRMRLRHAAPVLVFAFALLFVLRGLSLGIPYISPDLVEGCRCH